ncbi:outer membrane beta-barrel protein [Acidocella sp.]|uniref:outer membrane beta-barrel protein n=1 Tax=Acidocella sp. TaxID=50710 RepID=UPI00262F6CC3|nr:outer membrane beta-barrel protein [Acidocella sp.]
MITMRRQLLGLGFVAASSLLALNAAHAMNGPAAINIDGGPLGSLAVSGGADGYGYYVSNLPNGSKDNGANVGSALVQLQKTSGVLQFTIEIGSNGGVITVGTGTPSQTSINNFSTGPLYAGYVTIAPKDMPFTISAGRLASLEGYESAIDWYNPSQLATDIWYVQNSQSTGVQGTYTAGPVSATVEFGDGWDTHVFNFLQALVSYTINDHNNLNVYYAGNLGRTGLNARTYGWGSDTTVSGLGPYFMNSQMVGAYYSYTMGNLNVIPEVQYVYAKTDHQLGIDKSTSNLGAAVFGDYSFANTPYSLGGWVEYEKSQGAGSWFVGPNSEAAGFAISPTWQYKDLFARVNAGGLYLLNNKYDGATYGYGNSGTGKFQFVGTLEAGLLF